MSDSWEPFYKAQIGEIIYQDPPHRPAGPFLEIAAPQPIPRVASKFGREPRRDEMPTRRLFEFVDDGKGGRGWKRKS